MAQLKLHLVFFFLSLYIISHHKCNSSDEDSCLINLDKIKSEKRTCGNSCATSHCKNPRAQCLCEGPCGLVCVPPDLRCSSSLKPLEHGTIKTPKGNKFSSIAYYTCGEDFDLIGQRRRICQSSGKWSGDDPFCTPTGLRCETPELEIEKENAYLLYSTRKDEYYLGDEIKYTCELGFSHQKGDILTSKCEKSDDGKLRWTNFKFTCSHVVCREPESIQNGYHKVDELVLGSEVTYHCNKGYYINGFTTRVCLAEKRWSSSPPTCEIVTCLEPAQIENGNVQYDVNSINYLSFIQYDCKTGYVLNGPSVRQCDENGEYTGDEPKCVDIDCGQPDKPENGFIKYLEGTGWKKEVIYACNKHTTTDGQTSATCKFENQVAKWSSLPPLCIKHCEEPVSENALFLHQNRPPTPGRYYNHNERITMYCKSGYEIVSKELYSRVITAVCEDGEWTDRIECKPAKCQRSDLRKKYLTDRNWSIYKIPQTVNSGTKIVLECNSDYPEVIKEGILKCEYGEWTLPESEAECRKASCDVSKVSFDYGVITFNGRETTGAELGKILHGEKLVLSCNRENYELYVDRQITTFQTSQVRCYEGDLLGTTFQCKPGRCDCNELKQKLVAKGMEPIHCTDHIDSEERVNLKCRYGFSYSDTEMTKAECDNRNWFIADDNAKCLRNCGCRSLMLSESIKLENHCYRNDIKSGSSLTIVCAEDYSDLFGENKVSCNDGEWKEEGYCHSNCLIPYIENTDIFKNTKGIFEEPLVLGRKVYHKERIIIRCRNGYHAENTPNEVNEQCLDGRFEKKKFPNCILSKTKDESGEEVSTSTINYFVDTTIPEYITDSEEEVSIDSVVSETVLTTLPVRQEFDQNTCVYEHNDQNLHAYLNGELINAQNATKLSLGEEIIFRCYDITQFLLEGSKRVQCLYNNKWSGNIPTCKKLQLRSTDTAPVISYTVLRGDATVNNAGELLLPQDSELTLKCWWFQKNETPKWQWNNKDIDFEDAKADWNKDEVYYGLVIKNVEDKHTGYFSCTTPNKKTHGINVKIIKPKTTTSTTTTTTTTTTAPPPKTTTTTTKKPYTQVIQRNTKCQLQSSTEMDLFINGEEVDRNKLYYEHGSRLIFRCAYPKYFKLIGQVTTTCNHGRWIPEWPYCYNIDRYYSSYPAVTLLTRVEWKRLDNGHYWISTRNADLHFLCLYGSKHNKPEMTLNWKDVGNIDTTYYSEYENAWIVKPRIDSNTTEITFRCKIPDRLDNEITVHFGDTCTLNENDIYKIFGAEIIPSTRRFPFYVHGNIVHFKCTATTRGKFIPLSISCRNGYWIKTDTREKYCY